MLYSILDIKAESFGLLSEVRTDEEAIRSFYLAIQNAPKDTLMSLFPQDFAIYRIGEFDPISGILTQPTPPVQLCTGLEVLRMIKSNTFAESAVRVTSPKSDIDALESLSEEVYESEELCH